jgi:hypothetical protein
VYFSQFNFITNGFFWSFPTLFDATILFYADTANYGSLDHHRDLMGAVTLFERTMQTISLDH